MTGRMASDLRMPGHNLAHCCCAKICHSKCRLFPIPPSPRQWKPPAPHGAHCSAGAIYSPTQGHGVSQWSGLPSCPVQHHCPRSLCEVLLLPSRAGGGGGGSEAKSKLVYLESASSFKPIT